MRQRPEVAPFLFGSNPDFAHSGNFMGKLTKPMQHRTHFSDQLSRRSF